jgi:hypothetical protein
MGGRCAAFARTGLEFHGFRFALGCGMLVASFNEQRTKP